MAKYHTWWKRFWASLIDAMVFVPFAILDQKFLSPDYDGWVVIGWATVAYSFYSLYGVSLHARFGQTLGKRLLRIKVLDVHEQRIPTFRQALLRDIGLVALNACALVYLIYLVRVDAYYFVGAETTNVPGQIITWAGFGWYALELLTMLTNKKRRAFHDYIAGTVVVREA